MKLVHLAVSPKFAWSRLAARDSAGKDVEILILRHQLAVAQRQDPRLAHKLTWVDRAWLALLAELVPQHCIGRIRWIVTPQTLIRWHRDLLRRDWARRSARTTGRPRAHQNIKARVLRMARESLCTIAAIFKRGRIEQTVHQPWGFGQIGHHHL